jgi:hypothetical protein
VRAARRITAAERRTRLAVRHALAPSARVANPGDVARAVVALHATDPATVYLSAWARLADPTFEAIEDALYVRRTVVRMLAMRRTMFVVPVEHAPILHAAASRAVARGERRRNLQLLELLGIDDGPAWLAALRDAVLAVLEQRGDAAAQELVRDVPALATRVAVNEGKAYAGQIGLSSRVLIELAAEGLIVRGRPRGTWLSSQYRWAAMGRWLGAPLAELPTPEAQAALVRRWLERFGPGTAKDLAWWTGLTLREVRVALAAAGAVEVDLDGRVGYLLPDDLDEPGDPGRWIALLPSLDPTIMGWQGRDWYLGDHRKALFDSNGNAGATVWVDGRIVGGWATREGGEVVTRLLEDVGGDATTAIEADAARLTAWLGGVRVVPRFPTPLHRELLRVVD